MVLRRSTWHFGGIDHIAIGDARSDVASRMGARSVWHEAIGLATVYDALSGEQVTTIEHSAGPGDRDRHAGGTPCALSAPSSVYPDLLPGVPLKTMTPRP